MSEDTIRYYPDQDLLYFNKGESQDSLDIAGITIDFGFDNTLVGFEIQDATEVLADFTHREFDRAALERISGADIVVYHRGDLAVIVILLSWEEEGERVEETINLTLPDTTVGAAPA